MVETSSSEEISTKLQRIAKQTREAPEPEMVWTTLAHHMDLAWVRKAYVRTPKNEATGVDGQTAADDAANLDENQKSPRRAKETVSKLMPSSGKTASRVLRR